MLRWPDRSPVWVLLAGKGNHTAGGTKSKSRRATWWKRNSCPGARICLLVCIHTNNQFQPQLLQPAREGLGWHWLGFDVMTTEIPMYSAIWLLQCSEVRYREPQVREIQYKTDQPITVQYSTVQYNTAQYSTVLYNTVQYCTLQYNTVQYSTILYFTGLLRGFPSKFGCQWWVDGRKWFKLVLSLDHFTVHCSIVQYITVHYSTVQYCTMPYSTVQYSVLQNSTVQYSTVRHSTVQYSTVMYGSRVQ